MSIYVCVVALWLWLLHCFAYPWLSPRPVIDETAQ